MSQGHFILCIVTRALSSGLTVTVQEEEEEAQRGPSFVQGHTARNSTLRLAPGSVVLNAVHVIPRLRAVLVGSHAAEGRAQLAPGQDEEKPGIPQEQTWQKWRKEEATQSPLMASRASCLLDTALRLGYTLAW